MNINRKVATSLCMQNIIKHLFQQYSYQLPNTHLHKGTFFYNFYHCTVHFEIYVVHSTRWCTSSVKRNQLDTTCFIITLFRAQHVSDVNTSIVRSLRLIRSYFMGCIWFGVCWRSISVWLWWCGIRMQAEALFWWCGICMQSEALHTDTTPP